MTKKTLALMMSLLLATSSFSGITFAEGNNGPQDQKWQQRNNQHGDMRNDAPRAHDNQRNEANNDSQRNRPGGHRDGERREQASNQKQRPREQRNEANFRERDHFAWRGNEFRKGRPAPQRFRGDAYRVNDWRARGLHQPPSGQHWAYIDGNYVLIAAATGVITAILLNGALNH